MLAFQSYYIWQMHNQVAELEQETAKLVAYTTTLRADLCAYQRAAVQVNTRLNETGQRPLALPPPRDCPP